MLSQEAPEEVIKSSTGPSLLDIAAQEEAENKARLAAKKAWETAKKEAETKGIKGFDEPEEQKFRKEAMWKRKIKQDQLALERAPSAKSDFIRKAKQVSLHHVSSFCISAMPLCPGCCVHGAGYLHRQRGQVCLRLVLILSA